MKSASVAIHTQSSEGVERLYEDLKKKMGTIVDLDEGRAAILDAKLDREGLEELRAMATAGNSQ